MIRFSDDIQIWIGTKPVDMRCSIDGLLIQVSSQLKLNPQAKQLFLFYSKGKDKVKGLWWDKCGFVLIYKRLGTPGYYESHEEISNTQCIWNDVN